MLMTKAVCLETGEVRAFKLKKNTASYFKGDREFFDLDVLNREQLTRVLQKVTASTALLVSTKREQDKKYLLEALSKLTE